MFGSTAKNNTWNKRKQETWFEWMFFFPCFSGKQFLGTRGYNNSIPWNENPICFLRFSYSPKGPKMDSTSKINYRKLLIRFSNKNVFTIRHRFGLLESLILLIHFVFLLAHKLYRTQEFLLLQKYFYRFITPVTASFALQCWNWRVTIRFIITCCKLAVNKVVVIGSLYRSVVNWW